MAGHLPGHSPFFCAQLPRYSQDHESSSATIPASMIVQGKGDRMNRWSGSRSARALRFTVVLGALLALLTLFASSAAAIGGGQIGEGWGTNGVAAGQLYNPAMFGADPSTGNVYTGDLNGSFESEASNYRIQQFTAGGEFKAQATITRYPEAKKIVGLQGIAVDPTLHRLYVVESCQVSTTIANLTCKEGGLIRWGARKILVYSTTPEGGTLVPDASLPSISLPAGTEEIFEPKAITVDPSNHDIVLLGENSAKHKIVQRISSSNGALLSRFTDTTDKLKGSVTRAATSLAVSNTGETYTLTGSRSP